MKPPGLLRNLLALVGVVAALSGCRTAASAEPAQPIAFSHKLHAGDYQIGCLYCHSGARRSTVAGIPSLQRCMGCHRMVGGGNPEIARVREYWDQKMPIRWTKIVKVPDFVFFNHYPHVAKGLRCQECHGPVETMVQVRLYRPLDMDRCTGCHRERGAPLDCYTCHR
jgi:hypothetical protein